MNAFLDALISEFQDLLDDAIVVEGLTRYYSSFKAVDGLSFRAKRGTVFGLLGPNGAGKSTTIKMLTCQLEPTSGKAFVCGYDTSRDSREVKRRIGVVFEQQNLYDELSAYDNLDFFRQLHGLDKKSTDRVLGIVGMSEHSKKAVGKFSKGMKQKIMIARALINDPEVLFLDEPTSGLDPQSSRELRQLVCTLRDQGKTIILTTHNMEEADLLCDRLAIIHKGKIVAEDTPGQLKKKYGEDVLSIETTDGETIESPLNTSASGELFQKLSAEKKIYTVRSKEATLEDVFIRLTGERWAHEP